MITPPPKLSEESLQQMLDVWMNLSVVSGNYICVPLSDIFPDWILDQIGEPVDHGACSFNKMKPWPGMRIFS